MSKIACPKCKKLTPVIPPYYKCKFCAYSLSSKAESKTVISYGTAGEQNLSNQDRENSGVKVNISRSSNKNKTKHIPSDKTIFDKSDGDSKIKSIKKVKNNNPQKKGQTIVGWLVIHDENKAPASYDLFIGDNFFGTEAEGYEVDIPIINDVYVSRSHANIRVSRDFFNRFHYQLLDDGSRRPQGPSLNGTYINGNENRLPADQSIYLKDGDTIQVGETKLVFKTTEYSHTIKEAATAVLNSDYTHTVLLSNKG